MSATTTSAWAKPGAWALDSEAHEDDELIHQHKDQPTNGGDKAAQSDFPSLAAASKTKKKKGQTFSLHDFSSYASTKPAQNSESAGLTHEDRLMLPTGPRERAAEEFDRSKLGGGFRSYGSNSYDRPSRGTSDEPSRQGRDSNREFAPSRADEIDNWAAAKKSPVGDGYDRRESRDRGGLFSHSQSRANEYDSWVANKTFVPSEGRRFENRVGFESNGGADSGNWLKKKDEEVRQFGGSFDSLRERRGDHENVRGGADSNNWGRTDEGIGSGRPRLNLQPRTLPIGEVQQGGSLTVKPKGSSPFGDARPREDVLKGKDSKEIEGKLDSMKVKDIPKETDSSSFGRGSLNNEKAVSPEDRNERSWRRSDAATDVPPSSGQQVETVAGDALEPVN